MQQHYTISTEEINKLSLDSILIQSPYCIVREQESQFLIYNTHTDEMHLVAPLGNYIYQLCNGINSIDDICHGFFQQEKNNAKVNPLNDSILNYFESMLQRGLVKKICYD